MSGRVLLGLVLVAAVAVSGCKPKKISMQPGARTFTPDSYLGVWEAWTRDKESFSWKALSHEIHVAATFESWEFRWAYVVRYAYDYSLKPEARDEMLDASLASSRQEHRFFVALSGMDFRESNLAGKTSAWRVLLIDPAGNQTIPVLMERVRRPTAVDRVYFPSGQFVPGDLSHHLSSRRGRWATDHPGRGPIHDSALYRGPRQSRPPLGSAAFQGRLTKV